MPIIRGNKSMKVYKGSYSPLNIFKGAKKIAGYIEEFNSGEAILVDGITYDHFADVVVKGNTVQASDYYAKDGLLTQSSNYYAKDGLSSQYTDSKTMGKNLCPTSCYDDWESGNYGITGEKGVSITRYRLKNLIPIVASTIYYFHTNGSAIYVIRTYDINKVLVRSIGQVANATTITTGSTEYYLSIHVMLTDTTETAQTYIDMFNTGTLKPFVCLNSVSDKTFEPYKDTVKSGLVMELNGKNFFNSPATTTLQDRSGNGNVGTASGFNYRTTEYPDRVADFVGKIAGSVVENPNVAKAYEGASLASPSTFSYEHVTAGYSLLNTLNGATCPTPTSVNGRIPQQLFSFNVVVEFEKAYGAVPSADQTLAGKIAWLVNNLSSLVLGWTGYGSCPSGNKASIYNYKSSSWAGGGGNTSSSPNTLSITYATELANRIQADGFIHFIASTDASDGITPSTIYTDYVKLTMKFKPASGSDGAGGIKFDGIGSRIVCNSAIYNDLISINGEWAVEFMAQRTGGDANSDICTINAHKPRIILKASEIVLCAFVGGVYSTIATVTGITAIMNHIIVEQSKIGNYTKIFVNGVEKFNGTFVQIDASSGNYFQINNPSEPLAGFMQFARFYNRALSPSEVYQNYFAGVNLNIPSPTDASPVVSNLPSKTYKYTDGADIYEFTLPADLHGIGTAVDKVVFDKVSKKAFVERRVGKKVFNGTEELTLSGSSNTETLYVNYTDTLIKTSTINSIAASNFFKYSLTEKVDSLILPQSYSVIKLSIAKTKCVDITAFKAWLTARYNEGNPVNVTYELAIITSTPITFTKVTSSPYTEVPMAFLVANTPDPLHPANCYTNLPADTYKYTSTDGIYEFTLPEELRGIGTTYDKVVFDRVSHRGYLERRIGRYICTGNESWGYNATYSRYELNSVLSAYAIGEADGTGIMPCLSNYLPYLGINQPESVWVIADRLRIRSTIFTDVTALKSWLILKASEGIPLTYYYQLKTATRTPLTFTKVASSTNVEVPMAFLTSTPSLDYPADVWDVEGKKVISRGKNLNSGMQLGNLNNTTGANDSSTSCIRSTNFVPVKSNTQYVLQNDLGYSNYVYEYDINQAFIKYTPVTGGAANVFVTTVGTKFVRFRSTSTTFQNNLNAKYQLEEGAAQTVYETYVGRTEILLPVLRRIGAVSDEYNPKTGKLTKRISDWITLDNIISPAINVHKNGYKLIQFTDSELSNYGDLLIKAFKYDTKELIRDDNLYNYNDIAYIDRIRSGAGTGAIWLSVADTDTGFSQAYAPSINEVKAFLKGYKMCNADGTSPYYKSEVPYTPATWAEWTGVGLSKDTTGITLVADAVNPIFMEMAWVAKPSTKYGILYNIVSSSLSANTLIGISSMSAFGNYYITPQSAGNNKFIQSTPSTISLNMYRLAVLPQTTGQSVKLKDIRVFELPTGSQIEADFASLTADQLSAKYTFNGLCTKNWKKVTDGTGLTSTLPTASYDGYTPYKMLYQLATPVVSDFGVPGALPTFHPTTIIETDCIPESKATIDATVLVEEV